MRSHGIAIEDGHLAARSSVQHAWAATVSGAAMMLAASAASAQGATAAADSAGPVAEVVVTASRITAAGFDAPTPTTVLGADVLKQQAQPNLFTAIAELPALQGSTGTTVANNNTSTGMTGLSGLNLRGLGTFRTLTLLDGQRVVPANVSNIVDVSQFPQLLVQRVEVVTGGASASYGSDAVAGVVNFVTDKRFTGFKANVQGGVSTYGDSQNGTVQAAYGHAFLNDKLHFEVSGEYFKSRGAPGELNGGFPQNGRDPLPRTGNGSYALANTPAGQPQNNYYLDGAQDTSRSRNGLITAGPLQGIAFGPGGVPYKFQYGGSGVPLRNAAGGVVGCIGSICQGGDYRGITSSAIGSPDIEAAIDRKVIYGRLSYEVSDRLELYGTSNIADVLTITHPNPKAARPGLTAQCDNAFLDPSIADLCRANNITSFRWGTLGENLPYAQYVRNDRSQRRFVLGADGSLNLFGKEWTYSSYVEHGESTAKIRVVDGTLTPLYNAAIDVIRVNGQLVCRNPVARAAGCLPYNAFGDVSNSEEAFRWFAPLSGARQQSFQGQDAASFAFNGVPFRNWAGDVSVAVGVEWRQEFYKTAGDPYGAGISNSPLSTLYPGNPLLAETGDNWQTGNFKNGRGRYDVKEGFAEVGLPVWDTAPLGKLSLNGAIRATDYSTSGQATTWKFGGTWDTPLDGVKLRAIRSRDIRAPNLSDLFAAPVQVNSTFIDRFNGDRTVQATNSTVGNPNLTPEISANLEAGIVFQPSWLRGFRMSVDYFDINMKDAIQVLGGQQIIDLCYNGLKELCPNVNLNGVLGTNNPSFVRVAPFNLASLKTNGFDLEASYRLNLRGMGVPGSITLRGLASNTLNYITDPGVPGQPVLQLAGNNNANNPAPGTTGVAKWKAFLLQTWEVGRAQLTLTERLISSGQINPNYIVCQTNCPAPTVQQPTSNFNQIPGATYIDVGFNYKLRDGIEAYTRVENLFNELAPPFGSNSLYDTIGRRYTAGFRLSY
ncbi:MAG: TonB-dependent receptor [Caulobacteraceae bacterium]|nr:TonB-dependent receptor [Caulobacteraceae bacterium]